MAEFHEYDLRCLLALYVACLTYLSEKEALAEARKIMTNDADFVKAVQKYKHVVTHYFAAKTEIWMALFMKEVYGVTGGNLANEFAPSRGCIHFHAVLQAANRALRLTGKEIRKYARNVADALKVVDEFIEDEYGEEHHAEFPTRPDSVYSPHGLELRETFCNKTDTGKEKIKQFRTSIAESHRNCEQVVCNTIQHEFGYSACHVGTSQEDFACPVGVKRHNYRQHNEPSQDGRQMQSKKDVIDRRELKRKRWEVEHIMGHPDSHYRPEPPSKIARTKLQSHINMLNHCFCHSCSAYCLKCSQVQVILTLILLSLTKNQSFSLSTSLSITRLELLQVLYT